MSETKFTPGKWSAQFSERHGIEVVALDAPKTHRVVARCGGAKYRAVNARAIAALPALYEAGKSALEQMPVPLDDADRSASALAYRALRAALASVETT